MSLQVSDCRPKSARVIFEHAKPRITLAAKGIADGSGVVTVVDGKPFCGMANGTSCSEGFNFSLGKSVKDLLVDLYGTGLAVAGEAVALPCVELVEGFECFAPRAVSTNKAARLANPPASMVGSTEVGDAAVDAKTLLPLRLTNALPAALASYRPVGACVKLRLRLNLVAQGALSSVGHMKDNTVKNFHLGGGA